MLIHIHNTRVLILVLIEIDSLDLPAIRCASRSKVLIDTFTEYKIKHVLHIG